MKFSWIAQSKIMISPPPLLKAFCNSFVTSGGVHGTLFSYYSGGGYKNHNRAQGGLEVRVRVESKPRRGPGGGGFE